MATGGTTIGAIGVGGQRRLLRCWLGSVRSPWLAAVASVGSIYAVAEMALVLAGVLTEVSAIGAFLLVFAPPTVIATLPDATVLWRVGALFVGLHVGPLLHTPLETLSFGAFLDSFGAAIGGDGSGVLLMFVSAALSLPVLEAVGTWVRRERLVQEAARRRTRPGLSLLRPRSR